MRLSLVPALIILAAILSANAAFGQSLSILKNSDTNYLIQVTAPPGTPYTLQASANLHLWVDLQNNIQDPYTFQFDITGVSLRYFRLMPSVPPAPDIRIMVLGDSLANECCGWGPGFIAYFKPNATVINYAIGGYSSKVFLQSAEENNMLLIKPQYVLINFGAFDDVSGPDDLNYPALYTTLDEYADNLRTIAASIRGFNGVPIFVTVHAAQTWDANGNLLDRWKERNGRMKQVAAELNAPLVDLNKLTTDFLNQLGKSGSAFMHFDAGGPTDVIHLSPLGGRYVGRMLANALPDNFGPYLTGIFEPLPKP
jgi:lysophospholipase L1-like esterase